jgi:hypothetical protein
MTDLEPCPFCCGQVTYKFFEPEGLGDYEPQHNFFCDGCEMVVIVMDVTMVEAITMYNERRQVDSKS